MTPRLKEYLILNKSNIEKSEFDMLISREVIENGWLDELLDFLYECGATVSTEIITQKLIDYYITNDRAIDPSKKESVEAKARYLINKHQIALMKTILNDNK